MALLSSQILTGGTIVGLITALWNNNNNKNIINKLHNMEHQQLPKFRRDNNRLYLERVLFSQLDNVSIPPYLFH